MMDYLKVEELKPYYTYRIHARNGRVGIWRPEKGDFLLYRVKFNDHYTFGEYHWDLSDSFGTAKPLEELEKSPFTAKDMEYVETTWEEAGLDKPKWAHYDKFIRRPKEKEMLKYLKKWEDKISDPHPKEAP